MMQIFEKDGTIRPYNVEDGKVMATVQVGENCVSNPTIEDFYAQGWADYVAPTPTPYIPTKEELVERRVRERYSINQEFEVLRKRDIEPEAFEEYNDYVEECILWADQQEHR